MKKANFSVSKKISFYINKFWTYLAKRRNMRIINITLPLSKEDIRASKIRETFMLAIIIIMAHQIMQVAPKHFL
jgi:putative flippase GtrA